MIDSFAKGFYGRPREYAAFRSAVKEGDRAEIAATLALVKPERPMVDAFCFGAPRALTLTSNIISRRNQDDGPQVGSVEFMDELQQVVDLAAMRDIALDELPRSLPRGLRELSPFLERVRVPKFTPGKDYGTEKAEFESIQRGDAKDLPESEGTTRIKTGRDAAAFVHSDSPTAPWITMVETLLKEGVEQILPEGWDGLQFDHHQFFTLYGAPFFHGVIGEGVRKSGHLSFPKKWDICMPRPEEMAPRYDMGYLPLAYPEGSPMHPARYAMHSAAALVCAFLILKFFKGDAVVEHTGTTVRESAMLLADNIGYFRLHAGVHYASDHTTARQACELLADDIAKPYLQP